MSLRAPRLVNQYRGNRLTTAPATEPVTIAELKTHLRISGSSEDEYLSTLISEARQEIEDATGLALIKQVWQLTLDRWPHQRERWWDGVREGHPDILYGPNSAHGTVALPRYPLQSVDTVTVYDESGNSTAVTIASTFDVDTQRFPGRLTLQIGATWPIALRSSNAIEIVYTAGYGEVASDVPTPLKRAVRLMASYMYEHRGDCDSADAFVKSGALGITNRYRVIEV